MMESNRASYFSVCPARNFRSSSSRSWSWPNCSPSTISWASASAPIGAAAVVVVTAPPAMATVEICASSCRRVVFVVFMFISPVVRIADRSHAGPAPRGCRRAYGHLFRRDALSAISAPQLDDVAGGAPAQQRPDQLRGDRRVAAFPATPLDPVGERVRVGGCHGTRAG